MRGYLLPCTTTQAGNHPAGSYVREDTPPHIFQQSPSSARGIPTARHVSPAATHRKPPLLWQTFHLDLKYLGFQSAYSLTTLQWVIFEPPTTLLSGAGGSYEVGISNPSSVMIAYRVTHHQRIPPLRARRASSLRLASSASRSRSAGMVASTQKPEP